MATSNNKTEQIEQKDGGWSDQKKWTMGILSAAIIGLGAAGWKYATNHLPSPQPSVLPQGRVEFVAVNYDWDPSTKVLIKGWAALKGDEVTVSVDYFQVQNSSRTASSILAISAVLMRPVTQFRQFPAGEAGPRVAVGRAIPPGETILLEPFTTKIKLEQGQTGGAWLSFKVFSPGDGFVPVETKNGLF